MSVYVTTRWLLWADVHDVMALASRPLQEHIFLRENWMLHYFVNIQNKTKVSCRAGAKRRKE
jgi:hypothetical protein